MPTRLSGIQIEGYKSIREVDVKLRPLNILIGSNGAGKSNFVNAMAFLRDIRFGRLQHSVLMAGGAERLLHFGSKTTKEMSFELSFNQGTNIYSLNLLRTNDNGLAPAPKGETAGYTGDYAVKRLQLGPREDGREAGISGTPFTRIAEYVQRHLASWTVYHFHDTTSSSPLRTDSALNDNRELRSDGANIAAFLYLLKLKHKRAYEDIRSTVAQIAPFFKDFSLEPSKLNTEVIRLEWVHTNSDHYFDASSLSDGTLRFIALATLLLQPFVLRPSVILIDEPELGLHPSAIKLLAAMMRRASRDTEVIASTQSPLLLDEFSPEDILVADLVDGATTIRRLETEPLREWLEDYSLGELWEKNEFGGRPVAT